MECKTAKCPRWLQPFEQAGRRHVAVLKEAGLFYGIWWSKSVLQMSLRGAPAWLDFPGL